MKIDICQPIIAPLITKSYPRYTNKQFTAEVSTKILPQDNFLKVVLISKNSLRPKKVYQKCTTQYQSGVQIASFWL